MVAMLDKKMQEEIKTKRMREGERERERVWEWGNW